MGIPQGWGASVAGQPQGQKQMLCMGLPWDGRIFYGIPAEMQLYLTFITLQHDCATCDNASAPTSESICRHFFNMQCSGVTMVGDTRPPSDATEMQDFGSMLDRAYRGDADWTAASVNVEKFQLINKHILRRRTRMEWIKVLRGWVAMEEKLFADGRRQERNLRGRVGTGWVGMGVISVRMQVSNAQSLMCY